MLETTITAPRGRWKKYQRDIFGNLVKVNEPNPAGGTVDTLYTYTNTDKLSQVSMTRGGVTQTRTWNWNPSTQRLTSVTLPESGTTSYTYYANGLLNVRTDAKGQRVEHLYDTLNRLIKVNRYRAGEGSPNACQSVSIGWDTSWLLDQGQTVYTQGRPTKVWWGDQNTAVCTRGRVEELYEYSVGGLVYGKQVQFNRAGSLYTMTGWWIHDDEGRLAEEHYPMYGPKLSYGRDTYGYPNQAGFFWYDSQNRKQERPAVTAATWSAAGQMESMTTTTDVRTWSYNPLGQVTGLTTAGLTMEYRYGTGAENDGRLTHQVVNQQEVAYEYDSLGRLTKAETTGAGWGLTFGHDGFGNLLSQTPTAKGSTVSMSLSVNPANNRVIGATYDANGNVTHDGSTAFSYDVENRLEGEYVYDPSNHRIYSGGVYTFRAPDGREMGRYNWSGAPIEEKIWFAGQLIGRAIKVAGNDGWMLQRIVTDRLGSVRLDNTESMNYYPYGQEITSTTNDRTKFGTYFRDSGTLDYADQRYFRPGWGRFMSADPYVASGGVANPSSWNRYAYVEGDPVNSFDPDGRRSVRAVFDSIWGFLTNRGKETGTGDTGFVFPEQVQRQLDFEAESEWESPASRVAAYYVNQGTWSDCEGLGYFSTRMAQKFGSDPGQFVAAFRSFVNANDASVIRANREGFGIRGSAGPALTIMLQRGGTSGFRVDYQDWLETPKGPAGNVDQVHHFAAFFQLGYVAAEKLGNVTGNVLANLVAVYLDADPRSFNLGDIQLGMAAAQMGAAVSSGALTPGQVAGEIYGRLCQK